MSGYSEQSVGEDNLAHPATEFLAKPFTFDELRARLQRLLGDA